MSMIIELRDAAMTYQSPDGEVEALAGVSFGMEEGEFCSIVGPSGCGKSTLLSAIAGLERLDRGSVQVDGQEVTGPSPRIGLMPQRDQLFEWRSIWGNVTLGLTVRGQNTPERQKHVRELLDRYDLADFAHKRPGTKKRWWPSMTFHCPLKPIFGNTTPLSPFPLLAKASII